MEREELKSIIEALIFVSEEPITLDLMSMVFEETGVEKKELQEAIEELKGDYNLNSSRGMNIVEVADGYQLRSKPVCAEWIQRLNVPKPIRLSQPAMETLAIIAYRQPVMRSDIEEIRGVDSGGVLKTLLERGLIRIIGKADDAGNPLIYGTTSAFLEMFSLKNLKELPTLKEIEELEKLRETSSVIDGNDGILGQRGGMGNVIDEYKEVIVEQGVDPVKEVDDLMAIQSLEDSIKKVRRLEKEIFPKPVEEIKIVPKEGVAPEFDEEASALADTLADVDQDETASSQDNS